MEKLHSEKTSINGISAKACDLMQEALLHKGSHFTIKTFLKYYSAIYTLTYINIIL